MITSSNNNRGKPGFEQLLLLEVIIMGGEATTIT